MSSWFIYICTVVISYQFRRTLANMLMNQDVLPHRQHMRLEVKTGSIPQVQRSRYIFVARDLDSDTVAYEQNQRKSKSWNLSENKKLSRGETSTSLVQRDKHYMALSINPVLPIPSQKLSLKIRSWNWKRKKLEIITQGLCGNPISWRRARKQASWPQILCLFVF